MGVGGFAQAVEITALTMVRAAGWPLRVRNAMRGIWLCQQRFRQQPFDKHPYRFLQ
jgi:hypothetical protein